MVAAPKHQYQDLYAALLIRRGGSTKAPISRSVCRPDLYLQRREGESTHTPISRSVCRPDLHLQRREGESTHTPISRSVCRPDLYLQRREGESTHTQYLQRREGESTHTPISILPYLLPPRFTLIRTRQPHNVIYRDHVLCVRCDLCPHSRISREPQLQLGHITVYVIFSHECRLYIFFVLLKLTPSKFKDLIFLPDGQFPLLVSSIKKINRSSRDRILHNSVGCRALKGFRS